MFRKFSADTLVLATHNKGKIAEMRDLLAPYVQNVRTSAELNLPEPPETGTTFLENATIKALATARATKLPVLADDSGLCIDALDGAPGVYSADWGGHPRNFRAAISRVLQEMGDTGDRSAAFVTVLVLAWPDGHIEVAEGRVEGKITHNIHGAGGFGYDPIFRPEGQARTFGEMSRDEKQKISHRSRALAQLLEKYFQK